MDEENDFIDGEEELDYTITEIISKFKNTLTSDRNLLLNNNWVYKDPITMQEEFYDMEKLIVSTHISYAQELNKAIGDRTEDESRLGHKYLKDLIKSFKIHDERVRVFLKIENASSSEVQDANITSFKKRVEFRSEVSKNHARFSKLVKNISGSTGKLPHISLKLHAKTPIINLSSAYIMEEKSDEIKNYINKRKELENGK